MNHDLYERRNTIRRVDAVRLLSIVYHLGRKLGDRLRNEPGISRRQPRQEVDGLNINFVCRVHIFGSAFRPVGFDMSQELGELIDAENTMLTNVLKSDKGR